MSTGRTAPHLDRGEKTASGEAMRFHDDVKAAIDGTGIFSLGRLLELIRGLSAALDLRKVEADRLRQANKSIHDTLTAEVKRLKLLVGEPVFDPREGHSDSDPSPPLPAVGSFHG